MTPHEIQALAAELADQLRADPEELPLDHPLRQWLAAYDAAERAAQDAEDAARDARIANLRRRLAVIEGKLR